LIRGYLADPEQVPQFRGRPCDAPAAALRNVSTVSNETLASLGAFDLRAAIAAIEVPTLVVHGERDPMPLESAREWAQLLPNASLAVIPGSGHFPFVEQRPIFLQSVGRFLAATSASR
jgi:pimeloyl-ACP methyl ester carboxylesterase